jgi:HEAT repeat protein
VVGLCLAINFLVIAGIMFGRNARDSLFLLQFGVEYLPHMYFANAIVLVVCSLFYTALVDRIERGRFLGGVSVIFIVLLVVGRAVLLGGPRWFYPVLYILAQAIWNFSLLQFWTFLGDLFDTRQAKRLFPVVALGSLLGMIGMGIASRPVVAALGTENLLLLWAGLILAALVLGTIVFLRYRPAKAPPSTDAASATRPRVSEWEKLKGGFSRLGREPLLRNLALITFLLWTVFTVVDFSFSKVMRDEYPDKDQLAAFLGTFRGIAGFLCLVIQLFLTSTLIARLGVGTTITFHPAFLALATFGMTTAFGYVSVYIAKMGDHVLLYTVQDSSYQLLFSPVPVEQRARIRGFIDGYVKPLSMAAAGLLLLLGTLYLSLPSIAMIGFILSLAWVAVALTTRRGYIRALLENLQAGSPALRLAAARALATLRDPASIGALSQTLRSGDPGRVVAAMQLLEDFGGEETERAIADLLGHPDARVRATAASTLGRRAGAKYVDRITPLLEDPDARVRANAIEALAAAPDPALVAKLRPLLRDPSTRARLNTVLTIAAIQGVSTALESLPLLEELARGDATSRRAATFALGRLPVETSMALLADLLRDPELRVRCEAARALKKIGTPQAVPPLLEALAGPSELRRRARRALAGIVERHGDSVRQEIERAALAATRPEIRSELADVLGRLKNVSVSDTLLQLLSDPEWRVRWKVLKSFEKLARLGPLPLHVRAALFNYARQELASYRSSLRLAAALTSAPDSDAARVLAEALEEDRANMLERVFHMLGIVCGREQMLVVSEKLRSGDARARSDALEALDTLAPKEIGRDLLTVLEPAPAAPAGHAAPPLSEALAELARHPKAWVRACVANYLDSNRAGGGVEILRSLAADPAALVREAAHFAGWRIAPAEWQPKPDSARAFDDPALVRAAQRLAANGGDAAPLERSPTVLLTLEKALFLKSAPLFAALEGEELAALAEIALEATYSEGEIIFEENQAADHLYVVVDGQVEVFRRVNSSERPLALLGEKECFGEMAILDDLPRSASVRAVEPTTVLKIDRESFRELILERPQIAFSIFRILSGRLRHQNIEADHTPAVYSGGQYA